MGFPSPRAITGKIDAALGAYGNTRDRVAPAGQEETDHRVADAGVPTYNERGCGQQTRWSAQSKIRALIGAVPRALATGR